MRKAYLSILGEDITSSKEYHNHKENMAWVATALVVTGIPTATWQVTPDLENVEELVFALVLILAAALANAFVWLQLCAARATNVEILGYQQLRWKLATYRIERSDLNREVVRGEPDPCKLIDAERLSRVMAPGIVHEEIVGVINTPRHSPTRDYLSWISYAAIWLSTGLALLWLLHDNSHFLKYWKFVAWWARCDVW